MKRIFVFCISIITLLTIANTEIFACPKCNEDFRSELLKERANTLGAQELLKAIENQSGSNQLVSSPVKYSIDTPEKENSKEEIVENDSDDNSINIFTIIKFSSPLGFFVVSLIS